jgi:hypothetical protein
VALSACAVPPGRSVTAPPAPESFTAQIEVTGADFALSCTWAQSAPGSAVFSVTAPENLRGLVLTVAGTDCRAMFRDLATELVLPEQAFFLELLDALNVHEGVSSVARGDSIETRGEIRTGAFVLTQNAVTGLYERVELPHSQVQING